MLQIFPWLAWLAVVVSAVLLFVLWNEEAVSVRSGSALLSWFLVAGYLQFFAASALGWASGLALQTLLAVYLIIRWKVGAYR